MKLKKMMTSSAIIGVVLAMGLSITAFANGVGVVKADNVNIRKEASTDSEKLGHLFEGDEIEIIDGNGDWFKINHNGQEAYVFSDYICVSQAKGNVGANSVNVRNDASANSEVVGTVNIGDTVTVVGSTDNWYKIIRTNGEVAYVSKDFVNGTILDKVNPESKVVTPVAEPKKEESTPVITTVADEGTSLSSSPLDSENTFVTVTNKYCAVIPDDGLNIRSGAGTDFPVIGTLEYGRYVDVVAMSKDWIKIDDEGTEGFVSAEFVSVRDGEKPSRGTAASEKGQAVVDYAKQFLGTPYVWGGTDLRKGVDCSGFVYSVYKHFGITLERTSAAQAATNGIEVAKSELVPGDLIFFDTEGSNNGRVSHVGIYVGNGQYIQSSSGKAYSVVITDLYNDYSTRTYVKSKRIFR